MKCVIECRLSANFWQKRTQDYWSVRNLYPYHLDTLIDGGFVLFSYHVVSHDWMLGKSTLQHVRTIVESLQKDRCSELVLEIERIELEERPRTDSAIVSIIVTDCAALPSARATCTAFMGPLLLWNNSAYHVDTLASFGADLASLILNQALAPRPGLPGRVNDSCAEAHTLAIQIASQEGCRVQGAGGALYSSGGQNYRCMFDLLRKDGSQDRLIVHVDRSEMKVVQYEVMPFPGKPTHIT
jgi:hypothetical protein